MTVVLHDIRSAHNVGSIFRTADAAGVMRMILCGITPGPLDRFGRFNSKVTKVSLGAEKAVAWERAPSAPSVLERLRSDGFTLIAIEQDDHSLPYYQVKLTPSSWTKTALVLGNEISGLPRQILALADKVAEIPMSGKKESLNVAVAFGIVLFHLLPREG